MCFENYCFFSMTSIKELERCICTLVEHTDKGVFFYLHSDLPQKYDHLRQPIVLPFGYGRSFNWELFEMTGIRNDTQCGLKIIAWWYSHPYVSVSCQKFTVATLSFPHFVFSLISNFIERNRFSGTTTTNVTELLMTYCSCQTVVKELTEKFR